MTTVRFGGPVGSFLDRVQQRAVPVVVFATCEYRERSPSADPAQVEPYVQRQILQAIKVVVAQKMETGELTFRHLGTANLGTIMPEILAASGLEQRGIQVGTLSLAFGIDGHPPQAPQNVPAAAPPAAAPQTPQHDVAAGTFNLGGGHQLRVKIDGRTPENFLEYKASQKVWGWIIGAVIVGLMVLTLVGVGIYVFFVVKSSAGPSASAAKWDGKSTFECGGNDVVVLTSVTATAGVRAGGNCSLTMTGVSITAPVAIEAAGNATVLVTGGSIMGSTNSVVASANAKVDLMGTKVSGKAKASAGAKITGAP